MEQKLLSAGLQGILKPKQNNRTLSAKPANDQKKKKKKRVLSHYARGLDKDKYDFSVALTSIEDMRNKLLKHNRGQEFFVKRLNQERQHFYQICITQNNDTKNRKVMEQKFKDLQITMKRKKLQKTIEEVRENPGLKERNENLFELLETIKQEKKLPWKLSLKEDISKKPKNDRKQSLCSVCSAKQKFLEHQQENSGQIDVQKVLTEDFIIELKAINQPAKHDSVLAIVNSIPDFNEQDEEQQNFHEKIREKKRKNKEIAQKLLNVKNNLNDVSNSQFSMYIKDEEIIEELATRLYNMHREYSNHYSKLNPCSVPIDCYLNDIKLNMTEITKSVFTRFRNLEITPQQMKEEVKLENNPYLLKGADDFRQKIQSEFMRAENHQGLLSRIMKQKSLTVSQVNNSFDNPNMDIFTNVDELRKFETIPLGTKCLRSLLSKRNSLLLKENNLLIAKKLEEAEKIESLDKEIFYNILTRKQKSPSEDNQTVKEKTQLERQNSSSPLRKQEKTNKQKSDEEKKRMEAAERDRQKRMQEDRNLMQDMRFLQRLQEDGQKNIVWQPKAKELIDLEINRKFLEDMDVAEAFKLKLLQKKPRPHSIIKGYTQITREGIKFIKNEFSLTYNTQKCQEQLMSNQKEDYQLKNVNMRKTELNFQPSILAFDLQSFTSDQVQTVIIGKDQSPKVEQFSQNGFQALGEADINLQLHQQISQNYNDEIIHKEGTVLSQPSSQENGYFENKSSLKMALPISPEHQLSNMRVDRADADLSELERKEILKHVQNSYLNSKGQLIDESEKLIQGKPRDGKDIFEDIDGSTQQSGVCNPLSRAHQKQFKSNSEFQNYIENDDQKYHHSQIHQISPIEDTPSVMFENDERDVHQKPLNKTQHTRSIEKFITHKETKNQLEISQCYAHRMKTNRFMSKIKADANARKKIKKNDGGTTVSERELDEHFEFPFSTFIAPQKNIHVNSLSKKRNFGAIYQESFFIPLGDREQPAKTLRETRYGIKKLLPHRQFPQKRVSDLILRYSTTSSNPSHNQSSNNKIETCDVRNLEGKQSSLTLKASQLIGDYNASQHQLSGIDFTNLNNIKRRQGKHQTLEYNTILRTSQNIANQQFKTISSFAVNQRRHQSKNSQRIFDKYSSQKVNINMFPMRQTLSQTARSKIMSNQTCQDSLKTKRQEQRAKARLFTSNFENKESRSNIYQNASQKAEKKVLTHRMIEFLQSNQLPVFLDNKRTSVTNSIVIHSNAYQAQKDQTCQTNTEQNQVKMQQKIFVAQKTNIRAKHISSCALQTRDLSTQHIKAIKEIDMLDKQQVSVSGFNQTTLLAEPHSPLDQKELDTFLLGRLVSTRNSNGPYIDNYKGQKGNYDSTSIARRNVYYNKENRDQINKDLDGTMMDNSQESRERATPSSKLIKQNYKS